MISSEIWFMSDLSVVETLAKVKWFSPYKGFGFVSVEGITEDIFLHFSVFEASRLPSLGNGDIILCQISHTEKGFQVTAIKEIVQANKYVVEEGNEKVVNATLKWFNSTKGFGFAQLSTGEDVFIHSNLLKKRSISNLEPNQQLTLKIRYTNLGYEAVDIAVSPAPSGDSTEPAN